MAVVTGAIISGAGVAVSAGSAISQNRQARRASNQQADAMDRQAEADRDRLGFAREQYDDWREMFRPVAEDLRTMAYEDRGPDYGAIAGDVGTAFDTSQDINRRQQQRFGFNPEDGAVAEGELRYGLGRASTMVDAMNRARTAHKDQQWNRLSQFYGMGSGQGAQAANLVSAAHAGASGTFGQHAGAFGQQAAGHRAGANAAWGDAAGWAGWGYGQHRPNNPPPGNNSGSGAPGPWAGGYNYPPPPPPPPPRG